MMKTLYLVRHAKSSWNDSSLSDNQRPLNKRGLKNAPEMGERLNSDDVTIDLIVSSPVKRAFSTAQFLAKAIGYKSSKIVQSERLYFEDNSSKLDIVQHTDPKKQVLMLVGHNQDMTSFLNNLCGYQTVNMPICAIASIQFEQELEDVSYGQGKLLKYDFPKNIQ